MGKLLDLFFPPLCLSCRRHRQSRLGLCPHCLAQIETTGITGCICCGRHCGGRNCAPWDHGYSRVLSLAIYKGPWRQVVQNVKFGGDKMVAIELAGELFALSQMAGFSPPEAIVPVPGASKSWRNFNINALICKELARATGAPAVEALVRRPGRKPQVELDYRGRKEGLEDYIFIAKKEKKFCGDLWLVDDVYTTGTTAAVCSEVLKQAGARAIVLLVLAA